MRVVIVEDELAASENLTYLLNAIDSNIDVLKVLDSVKDSVKYFAGPHTAELVFMDIHLADGISFEIFDQVNIDIPVIFITAYNQYTLKAFKFNSIDYLLKPLDKDELTDALEQFKVQTKQKQISNHQIKGLLDFVEVKAKTYKATFLVSHRDELIPIKVKNIAYFRIDTGLVKAVTTDNKSYVIDSKLEDLEEELDPEQFYRANRQFIIKRDAVANIKQYFNSKLIVVLNPICDERVVISKAKATEFKAWVSS